MTQQVEDALLSTTATAAARSRTSSAAASPTISPTNPGTKPVKTRRFASVQSARTALAKGAGGRGKEGCDEVGGKGWLLEQQALMMEYKAQARACIHATRLLACALELVGLFSRHFVLLLSLSLSPLTHPSSYSLILLPHPS